MGNDYDITPAVLRRIKKNPRPSPFAALRAGFTRLGRGTPAHSIREGHGFSSAECRCITLMALAVEVRVSQASNLMG
jgi:hypothetical protein